MLGEIFLLKFLTSLFGLFLSFLFVYLPIILAIIAYRRKWGIKKFLRRVVESITIIITIIIVIVGGLALLGNFTEIKDPVEEMVNNPQKYKDMPCFEVEFNKEKYCFDRSRIYFEKKYIDRITKEDESAVIYFLPKVLSNFPPEEREVRIDLKVDKYHRDDLNEPERFVRNFLNGDKNNRNSIYQKLISDCKDRELCEITKMMEDYWVGGFNKNSKYFTYKIDERLVIKIDLKPSNDSYKFISDIVFQIPTARNYFEVHFVSNQSTQKEFLQTALDISREFNQFLIDSKAN